MLKQFGISVYDVHSRISSPWLWQLHGRHNYEVGYALKVFNKLAELLLTEGPVLLRWRIIEELTWLSTGRICKLLHNAIIMLFYYIRATGNAKCYGVIRYNKAKSTDGKKTDNMTSLNDLNVDLFKFSFGLFCDGRLSKTDSLFVTKDIFRLCWFLLRVRLLQLIWFSKNAVGLYISETITRKGKSRIKMAQWIPFCMAQLML